MLRRGGTIDAHMPLDACPIPLARCADHALLALAHATGSPALAKLDGVTLLGERAMRHGMSIPGHISAGGGCRLFEAVGDTVALNLAREADRELLPALLEADDVDTHADGVIARLIARCDAAALVARGRSMGMAIAAEREHSATRNDDLEALPLGARPAPAATHAIRRAPRVLDLSALWAGPLAGHLLWLAGADVVKVESRTRPDAMRSGADPFYALLNQGKASVVLDFADAADRRALLALILASDIVIEAARPRALLQLGIDADQIRLSKPGLVWVSITAHGTEGERANWVGFGDDCGVAGGLSAALRRATGRTGFVGDAMADPLTGIFAAWSAWENWQARRGGRLRLAMSQVIAQCLAHESAIDPMALDAALKTWGASVGMPFPTVNRRPISGAVASFGEHTRACLAQISASP